MGVEIYEILTTYYKYTVALPVRFLFLFNYVLERINCVCLNSEYYSLTPGRDK